MTTELIKAAEAIKYHTGVFVSGDPGTMDRATRTVTLPAHLLADLYAALEIAKKGGKL